MRQSSTIAVTGILAVLGIFLSSGAAVSHSSPPTWNPQRAASYLDQRQTWWEVWPKSARDHATVCLSCHTALPYALARPELRDILHERELAVPERKLVADVVTRVRSWGEVKPYYGDSTPSGLIKAVESRGTEAVLNALLLAARDNRERAVSVDARQALANMFALQQKSGDQAGAWRWLDLGLRPWESSTSVYFGAALGAVAVGLEPQLYAERPEIQPNLDLLRRYLRSHLDQSLWSQLRRRDDARLLNRAMLLWASARLPKLLSTDERRTIIASLCEAQQSDGSWKSGSLGRWRRATGLGREAAGDGYATGLIAYALEEVGTPPDEPHLARGLGWLASHQDATTGMWSAASLNKDRNPATNVGKFMSDAATAFAVLALGQAEATEQARRTRP